MAVMSAEDSGIADTIFKSSAPSATQARTLMQSTPTSPRRHACPGRLEHPTQAPPETHRLALAPLTGLSREYEIAVPATHERSRSGWYGPFDLPVEFATDEPSNNQNLQLGTSRSAPCPRGSVRCASMAERAGSRALKRRRSRNPTRSAAARPAGQSVRSEPRLVAGFDVAGARGRGLPVDELAQLKAQSRYLGAYAWELGLDPLSLCPLCGEMFGGWCLHADHVMPEHFAALYLLDDEWLPVRDAEDVPDGSDVYHAVQCAAYAHAPCNLRKGSTADVAAWRLPGLPPLIVAESDTGAAVAVPGPVIVAAAPRTPEQRTAETLGLQHAKTGSGSVRGRRLSIEERNREAQLAQQALAAHQHPRLSQQRPGLYRPRVKDSRSALCNFTGHSRPMLCVGDGPRECWCAKVLPAVADRLVAALGREEALAVLIEDPPRPMQALSEMRGQTVKTAHRRPTASADPFRRSKFCVAGCTGEDTACAACLDYLQWKRGRSTADAQLPLWEPA